MHEHHHHDEQLGPGEHGPNYNIQCNKYGSLCLYANDSTFTLSNDNIEELDSNLDKKYKEIAQYMERNKLILNNNKTHLMIMTSNRKHANHQDFGLSLNTGSEIIQPQS